MRYPHIQEQHISNVKKWRRKTGKAQYLRYLQGEELTRDEAIQAKCYDCVCGEDTEPCLVPTCPLTQHCQWNKPKKAMPSNTNSNSPDAVQSGLQDITDPAMAQECVAIRDQNREVKT